MEHAGRLAALYRDLHAHPELSFAEHRTAGIAARHAEAAGWTVTRGVGRTGVVAELRNGPGPTVLLRADMDALPVRERTGLEYASTVTATDPDGVEVPVMHACGHDVHVTCLIGAVEELTRQRDRWSGTVLAVFQPAEERGGGARAMIDDGLYDRFPVPDVVLGQHVSPMPAGMAGCHPGPAFAAADVLRVRMFGRGGHGSRPETTVDPVVMAAATVMRLQTVVAREVAAADTAVVTVGMLRAGSKENVIPDEAELGISVRSFTEPVRARVLEAVHRIVRAEAAAAGAPKEPEITTDRGFPVVVNDPDAAARTVAALRGALGAELVIDPGPVSGSEDVGHLATAAGAPLCYWLLGGADPEVFARATADGTVDRDLPSNHSPHFAPVVEPTLTTGVRTLTTAAREWLD
ncbi:MULTISPECIES: amidohydrolase [Streptomycetaceae]|uniref:Amidohydrolase n=1 Tax=Streptantibioticus cattleyicolor (strain ATCC 35852 / DSM 46488 / JCM 4925 / NBRC 14057 / NRRL 8057) TaxID=1003195 RepID=F8K1H0_STREN|nr:MULTISPECIES: amidohydrolase [Streptomycetaceae]AEW97464.1 amidohydrolase [Streptantibioticus cattleyicolor NRRL 8057 = DSM 46488]MYS61899.1 amidohydrolase [Streptomyces sp. SID5468]CCB77785.1 putative Metal-dependent amidase/aminoacylase/carboxypeptidase [Streptantibioticus cattleyicolor NRRL 8057 = DSM 46488]